MKLRATDEHVVARGTIDEDTGSVSYNKCAACGRPGNLECVLAIHDSLLRLEFYEPYGYLFAAVAISSKEPWMGSTWTRPAAPARIASATPSAG